METIAECVGGCADGVQLLPDDPSEPDDWPDGFQVKCKDGGATWYERRVNNLGQYARPKRVNGRRVYYFDAVGP